MKASSVAVQESRANPAVAAPAGSVATKATHLLVELHGCDSVLLDDPEYITRLMCRASEEAGATVLAHTVHRFLPQGVTLVCTLAESHFSIHTWPEAGYAAVDFYTCGQCVPERAVPVLVSGLAAARWDCLHVLRGLSRAPSFHVSATPSGGGRSLTQPQQTSAPVLRRLFGRLVDRRSSMR